MELAVVSRAGVVLADVRAGSDLAAGRFLAAARDVDDAARLLRGSGAASWRGRAADLYRARVDAEVLALDRLRADLDDCARAWHRHAEAVEATWRHARGVLGPLLPLGVPGRPSGWGL